jgi:hypothetical protein
MPLDLAGDVTVPPETHTAGFIGLEPCDASGQRLAPMINAGSGRIGDVDHDVSFSAKPRPDGRYRDFHHKVSSYVARLAGPARELEPHVTAQTFEPLRETDVGSVFRYADTATPRAGLERYADRLAAHRVAIIGLGGSGSYILDLVAKTSVAEIHLYDSDRLLQHNAFRAPGATSITDLRGGRNKAIHWRRVYGRLRRGIHAHPRRITSANVATLRRFDFVFIAIDDGPSRDLITRALEGFGVPYVDVGLGVTDVDDRLLAIVRVSTGTPAHAVDRRRLPVAPTGRDNEYRHNIQVADLNALNAALAVLRWKKLTAIYADLGHEHFSTLTTTTNTIRNVAPR